MAKKIPGESKAHEEKIPSGSEGVETAKVTGIIVRMYRGGTGDFFLLKFMSGSQVTLKMMIDCGCIHGSKQVFTPLLADLRTETEGKIDILVVTHEHADHINGFKLMAEEFKDIVTDRVWFAWTEDDTNQTANEYRRKQTKMKTALAAATMRLDGLEKNKYYATFYQREMRSASLAASQDHFIMGIKSLNDLNISQADNNKIPTMVDLLRQWNVIKPETKVEFLSPGEIIQNLPGAPGIRIFVLGPPTDLSYLSIEERSGENYKKRESKSTIEFSFVNAFTASGSTPGNASPFDTEYHLTDLGNPVSKRYKAEENAWQTIDNDWLFSAGSLALKLQQSINNTSLALAIQFEDNEHVLLFPGDAEYGCWKSWLDNLKWTVTIKGKRQEVDIKYLLNNTVFYKVSHHLSQNGTAKANGIEMMTHEDLVSMVTLDLNKIMDGWRNTMPNDLLGAELINRTKGKLYFTGDRKIIMKNIMTGRVTVRQADVDTLHALNAPFDGKPCIEHKIT